MTPEQAKEFFRSFNGSSFHMSREEPEKLKQFKELNISEEVKDSWCLEMAREYLDKISSDNPQSWVLFSLMTSVLTSVKFFSYSQENMFIEGIEKQTGSDLLTRTITLETICGRTYDHHDGVIAYFRKNGMNVKRLKEAADKLISYDPEDERYKRSITLYHSLI